MMFRKVLAISVVALVGSSLSAQHEEHGQAAPRPAAAEAGHGGGMPMRLQIHAAGPAAILAKRAALSISEAQVQQLTRVQARARTAHDEAHAAATEHFRLADVAWQAGSSDDVLRHAAAGMQSMQTAHMAMLTATMEARGILNPTQRARVDGWLDAMAGHQAGGMGGMEH